MSVQGTGVMVTAGGPGSGPASARDLAAKGVMVNAARYRFVHRPLTERSVTNITGNRGLGEACAPRAKGINGQGLVLDGGAVRS